MVGRRTLQGRPRLRRQLGPFGPDRVCSAERRALAGLGCGWTPTAVTKLDDGEVSHRLPQFLPDGDTVLSTVTKSGFPSWDDTLVVAQRSPPATGRS